MDEYRYWEVEYISVEGNYKWSIARAPEHWEGYDVERAIRMGGVGDDPYEIQDVFEIYPQNEDDYTWDLTEEDL